MISLEGKKYLSLYLGIINSPNRISNKYKTIFSELSFEYELLNSDSYNYLYNLYFAEKLNNINFNSINDYFNFLLEQEVIKKVNDEGSIFKKNDSNKILVKK